MMKKKYCSKESTIAWILLASAICFMFCVFAPLDAYFSNMEEYFFSLGDILPVVAVVFIIAMILLTGVFLLLDRTPISPILFALFSAVLLFFYVQGNYIPRNYGVLNGAEIDWESYSGLGIASIVLAVVCIALSFVVILKFRKKAFVIGKYLAIFLMAIQVIALGTSFIQKELLSKNKATVTAVVTQKDLLTLSKEGHNIVVLVLDTFDGKNMNMLLEEDSDKYAEL